MWRGAAAGAQELVLTRVLYGLDRPVFVSHAPGDPWRLFILEQHSGKILIYDRIRARLHATPFMIVRGLSTGGEQGLLGIAFHPRYRDNGFFYVIGDVGQGAREEIDFEPAASRGGAP